MLLLILSSSCSFEALMKKGKVVQKQFEQEIPFEFSNYLIIIETEVGEKKRRFLFDSGAPNVISKELQEEMQFKVKKTHGVSDGKGERNVLDFVKIEEIRLGDLAIKNTIAAVTDLNQSREIACLNIDGIIGANLMAKGNWIVDYQNKKLHFTDFKKDFSSENPIVIPFRRTMQQTPEIHVGIGNFEVKNITFDLGSNGGLHIRKSEIQNPARQLRSFGLGSASLYGVSMDTIFYAYVNPLQIGGVNLGPAWIKTTNNSSRSLGNKFWSDFKVYIDFDSDRILLERVRESRQSMLGFGFVPRLVEDKWIVGSVIIESAAFDQGLRPGDEIVRINDMDYFEVSEDAYCKQFIQSKLIPEDDYIIIDVRSSDENQFEKRAELERVEFFEF